MSGFKDKPIPLITVSDAGQFEVGKEAEAYLRQIPGKIGVVAVAGPYRSGKSYVLNRLLGRQDGFEVGPTVNAMTKGIYIWGKPIPVRQPSGETLNVVLIDTEGIGSTEKDETYDAKIFALAVLLSSYFVYNSFSVIDEGAIDKLSLVANLSKHIQVRSFDSNKKGEDSDSADELSVFFPSFMWLLRDFMLDLTSFKGGHPMSAKEYLEENLELKPVPEKGGERVRAKNQARKAIKDLFRDRDCSTIIRPVMDEKQLRNIDQIPSSSLRPEFLGQVNTFTEKVLHSARAKMLFGKAVTGEGLAILCKSYTSAINTGAVPSIRKAWENIGLIENPRVMKQALATYLRLLVDTVKKEGGFPLSDSKFNAIHEASADGALAEFNDKVLPSGDVKGLRAELIAEIAKQRESFEGQNSQETGAMCKKLLAQLYAPIEGQLQAGNYTDMNALMADWAQLRQRYMNSPEIARSAKTRALAELAELEHYKLAASVLTVETLVKRKADKELGDLRTAHAAACADREAATIKSVTLEGEVKHLAAERDRSARDLAALEQRAEKERERSARELAALEQRGERERAGFEARIQQATNEKAEIERRLTSMGTEARELQTEISKLHSVRDRSAQDLTNERKTVEAERLENQRKMEQIQAAGRDVERALGTEREQVRRLQSVQAHASKLESQLESERKGFQDRLASLESSLAARDTQATAYETELSNAKQLIASQTEQIKSLLQAPAANPQPERHAPASSSSSSSSSTSTTAKGRSSGKADSKGKRKAVDEDDVDMRDEVGALPDDEPAPPSAETKKTKKPLVEKVDPNKLTVAELKALLTKHQIELPPSGGKKSVYVDLYNKHLG
eukprot:TRINITY_DN4893_c0_g1_i1.p1 TRINITY_DN4893_c0_g1~~TRINITY_DN4893_c0_g1_i1.p1  ORF type:complete len:851 (-),score=175.02 TRINITY_DN4893_c0_g1_i1:63-2615(-)